MDHLRSKLVHHEDKMILYMIHAKWGQVVVPPDIRNERRLSHVVEDVYQYLKNLYNNKCEYKIFYTLTVILRNNLNLET